MQPIGHYGRAYGKYLNIAKDLFNSEYTNVRKKVKVDWASQAVKVSLAEEVNANNFFKSDIAMTQYSAATNEFKANQFRFHHPSEHTVNGKYYDLEMQIYHDAKEFNDTANIKYGAVALFFSVKNYDQSISTAENETIKDFIQNLKFDDLGDPIVDVISFGEIMKIARFDQRWVYKGSMTQPPCDIYVYWNVLRRVLPITPV